MPNNKMERFTQRARRVLSLAQEEAERLRHNYIGTEHLLLGLIREEGGIAGRVLRDLGLEQAKVEELVEELTRATAQSTNITAELSLGTKRVLELSVDEARRMGHHYIDTEHLLLGLVRQSEGVAIDVLKRSGISPEEVRRLTRRVLQESPVQNSPPASPPVQDKPLTKSSITEEGGRVLILASEFVNRLQHDSIRAEHLLVGLLREENGIAGLVLRDLGLEYGRVEELVQELSLTGIGTSGASPELSSEAKRLLERAVDEAQRMGHQHIHTEHMLLGLVQQPEGVAIDVLKRLGVNPEEVGRKTRRILHARPIQNPPPLSSHRPERLVQYIGTNSIYLIESMMKKMLDMVGDGKLTVEQANEMLATLQPGLKLNTGMQAWLTTLVNQKEQQDKRHVRVVAANRETGEESFTLTMSLLEGLEKLDQLLLATVPDNQLKSVAFESDSSPIRIEIYVENNKDKPDE